MTVSPLLCRQAQIAVLLRSASPLPSPVTIRHRHVTRTSPIECAVQLVTACRGAITIYRTAWLAQSGEVYCTYACAQRAAPAPVTPAALPDLPGMVADLSRTMAREALG